MCRLVQVLFHCNITAALYTVSLIVVFVGRRVCTVFPQRILCLSLYSAMLRVQRPSVCLSVTSVDCDHTVQQKVEIGTLYDRIGWSLVKADPGCSIV